MTKKIIILMFLGLSACLTEEGKEPAKPDTFVRLLSGGHDDTAQDIKQTDDGGFILLSTTEVKDTDNLQSAFKIKLIKLDKYGHAQWKKNYPAYKEGAISAVSYKGRFIMVNRSQSAKQVGYLIVGDSIQGEGKPYIRVMITDNDGNVEKTTTITGSDLYEGLEGIAATIDDAENYVILGSITNTQGSEDMFLTALDVNLKTIWTKTYGAGTTTLVSRLFNDDLSSSLFWAGSVLKNGISDIRFVKINPNSQSPEFDLPIGETEVNETVSDFCKYGFGFAFVGTANTSGNADILLKRLTKDGIEVFSKTYGNPNYAEEGLSVATTIDGGLILLASTDNSEITKGERDFYLMKIDPFGEKQWTQVIGGKNNDVGVRVLALLDGSFLILGTTSFGGLSTITLIKTDKYGNVN